MLAWPQPPSHAGAWGSSKQPCSPRCPCLDVLGPAGEILWLGQAGAALGLVLFLQPWLEELLAFGAAQRHLLTARGNDGLGQKGSLGWYLTLLLRCTGIPQDPQIPTPSLEELL